MKRSKEEQLTRSFQVIDEQAKELVEAYGWNEAHVQHLANDLKGHARNKVESFGDTEDVFLEQKHFFKSQRKNGINMEISIQSLEDYFKMILPFKTHTIYISFDNEKIYKLNEDLSREEVKEIPKITRENPFVVLNKVQFNFAKDFLLNKENPFKISVKEAALYNEIGFISDDELFNFIKK